MRWNKVTIIGVGLLGGSIGLALRERKLAREVRGYVRRQAAVKEAIKVGAVDRAGTDLAEAVCEADLIILCTPIAQMKPLARQISPALKRGTIITDVGSVKAPLVRTLGPLVGKTGGHFVGSHPMAGSEKGGVRVARADLFQDAVCVVTPDGETNATAVRKVSTFWRALGARVLSMDAALHDRLVSRASHLPHMVASVLAKQVLDPLQDARQATLCATGFRDTTRVAGSSPGMWRDIAMANRANLIRDLTRTEANLAALRQCLESGDGERLEQFLTVAQRLRLDWDDGRVSSSQE